MGNGEEMLLFSRNTVSLYRDSRGKIDCVKSCSSRARALSPVPHNEGPDYDPQVLED